MKKILMITIAVLATAALAAAQAQGSAQGSTSAGASVQAGHGQANTSVSASQNTNASAQQQDGQKGERKGGSASTSGNVEGTQSASAGNGSTGELAAGTTLQAELTKSVDARKAKEGQQVTAKTTQQVRSAGNVIIPKGAKLIGHVTEAKARAKGEADSQSSLGIAFDHAVLKNGQQIPFHAVIQALAAAQANTMADTGDMGGGPMVGEPTEPSNARPAGQPTIPGGLGTTMGTATNTVGNAGAAAGGIAGNVGATTAGTVNGTTGAAAGNVGSTLGANASGVHGLKGLQLDTAASNAAQGSVITSTGNDVKLDSGTQMVLRVVSQ